MGPQEQEYDFTSKDPTPYLRPTKHTIDLSNFSQSLKNFSQARMIACRNVVIEELNDSLPELEKESPKDIGLYSKSWSVVSDSDRAIIGNDSPYAPYIERGTIPFMPPFRPLFEWAQRVIARGSGVGNPGALAQYARQKIAQRGLLPRWVMANVMTRVMERIKNRLRETSR